MVATGLEIILSLLVKNVATFGIYPKNLPEIKLKSFGIISLAEEIPRQPNIDYIMWLLEIMLMQIYKEKQQARKSKYKKNSLRRYKTTGNLMFELSFVLKR